MAKIVTLPFKSGGQVKLVVEGDRVSKLIEKLLPAKEKAGDMIDITALTTREGTNRILLIPENVAAIIIDDPPSPKSIKLPVNELLIPK